jgi:hypothetical protein
MTTTNTTTQPNNHLGLRAGLSVALLIAWGFINAALRSAAPLISGDLSAQQLKNSNVSYATSQTAGFFTGQGLPFVLLLLALVLLWWKPLKNAFRNSSVPTLLLGLTVLGGSLCFAPKANAYYDPKNYPEFYTIGPSESAFAIPLVGANEDSQVKFM